MLVIGLLMFGVIWLNVTNLAVFLGKEYEGIETIILLMGIGKLIDLGTGANSQIIGTSSYWKVDFTTNAIYTLLALPLNYFLIAHYGLIGAAYSFVIALTFYNLMRFGFLWAKFKFQPYTWKDFLVVVIAIICTWLVYLIPHSDSVILDTFYRTLSYLAIFIPAVYYFKISSEINNIIENFFTRIFNFRKRP